MDNSIYILEYIHYLQFLSVDANYWRFVSGTSILLLVGTFNPYLMTQLKCLVQDTVMVHKTSFMTSWLYGGKARTPNDGDSTNPTPNHF